MRRLIKSFIIFVVVMAFMISGIAGAARLDLKRLLVFYPCDETSGDTLNDASGNGWHASAPGAKWEKGVFGNAVRLTKVNSEVKGDIISSTAKTGEISIMCWFYMYAHSTYNGLVSIANPSCDASCCYRLMVSPGKNPFWNAGRHSDKSLNNFTFDLKRWYHYALVTDGKDGKIFVDGKFIGSQAEGIKLPELVPVTVYVGTGENPGAWRVEDCAIDEVMIWDKALTEDEMSEIIKGSKVFMAVQAQGKLATAWGELKR